MKVVKLVSLLTPTGKSTWILSSPTFHCRLLIFILSWAVSRDVCFFTAFAFYFIPYGDCGVCFICHPSFVALALILWLVREYNFQINSSCEIMVNSSKTSLIVGWTIVLFSRLRRRKPLVARLLLLRHVTLSFRVCPPVKDRSTIS